MKRLFILLILFFVSCAPVNYNYNPDFEFCFYYRNGDSSIDNCSQTVNRGHYNTMYVADKQTIERIKRFLESIDFLNIPVNQCNRSHSFFSGGSDYSSLGDFAFSLTYGSIFKEISWHNEKSCTDKLDPRIFELRKFMDDLLFNCSEYKVLPVPETFP